VNQPLRPKFESVHAQTLHLCTLIFVKRDHRSLTRTQQTLWPARPVFGAVIESTDVNSARDAVNSTARFWAPIRTSERSPHKRGSLTFLDRATKTVEGSQLGALLWVLRTEFQTHDGSQKVETHTVHCRKLAKCDSVFGHCTCRGPQTRCLTAALATRCQDWRCLRAPCESARLVLPLEGAPARCACVPVGVVCCRGVRGVCVWREFMAPKGVFMT
jgi:hypothetical protein